MWTSFDECVSRHAVVDSQVYYNDIEIVIIRSRLFPKQGDSDVKALFLDIVLSSLRNCAFSPSKGE